MYFKYPRTPHLSWSESADEDDIVLDDARAFTERDVVVTEKLDGENTSLYPEYLHARSIDNRYHPSRDWIKRFHGQIRYLIPSGWRVCGENMYAKHSIFYPSLENYFYLFSVWDDKNTCLSWDDTKAFAKEIGAPTPPELYRGIWDESTIKSLVLDTVQQEGYVVRLSESFAYADFSQSVAKWVRKGHVQTSEHWMSQAVTPNGLK